MTTDAGWHLFRLLPQQIGGGGRRARRKRIFLWLDVPKGTWPTIAWRELGRNLFPVPQEKTVGSAPSCCPGTFGKRTAMIPDFTEDGLLPAGMYRATREVFRERFAKFDRSDRRLHIFEQIEQLLAEAEKSGIVKRILVGGSFVTAKPEPNDFDMILVLDSSIVHRNLRPFEYNLVSRSIARRLFGGDVIPALEGSAALERYVEFFQTTRGGQQVGLVEIGL